MGRTIGPTVWKHLHGLHFPFSSPKSLLLLQFNPRYPILFRFFSRETRNRFIDAIGSYIRICMQNDKSFHWKLRREKNFFLSFSVPKSGVPPFPELGRPEYSNFSINLLSYEPGNCAKLVLFSLQNLVVFWSLFSLSFSKAICWILSKLVSTFLPLGRFALTRSKRGGRFFFEKKKLFCRTLFGYSINWFHCSPLFLTRLADYIMGVAEACSSRRQSRERIEQGLI